MGQMWRKAQTYKTRTYLDGKTSQQPSGLNRAVRPPGRHMGTPEVAIRAPDVELVCSNAVCGRLGPRNLTASPASVDRAISEE